MLKPRHRDGPWKPFSLLDLSSVRGGGFPRAPKRKQTWVLEVCPGLSFSQWSIGEEDQATTLSTFFLPFSGSNRGQDLVMLQGKKERKGRGGLGSGG